MFSNSSLPEMKSSLNNTKNRLETKHIKTISVCVAPNGVQRRVFAPNGVRKKFSFYVRSSVHDYSVVSHQEWKSLLQGLTDQN